MIPTQTSILTRLATLADLASIAPLFNAYRQFYEQTAQALYESEDWMQDAVFLTYNKAVLTV
jgi:hypothetical protein